jgi:hypothetical protein
MKSIRFTNSAANVRSIARVFELFKFKKQEKDEMIDRFVKDTAEFGIWIFNVDRRSFEKQPQQVFRPEASPSAMNSSFPSVATVATDPAAEFVLAADHYIDLFFEEPRKAKEIFSFIVNKLPATNLDKSDLTIKLQNSSGETIKLSLLDFLNTLVTDATPSPDMYALRNYISRYCTMPRLFVKNEKMQNFRGGGRRDRFDGLFARTDKLHNKSKGFRRQARYDV